MSVTTTKPTGAKTPDAKVSDAPTYKEEQYDLLNIVRDRGDIRQRTAQFIDDVIVAIDQLSRQADPDTPYLTASTGSSANITQYTDDLIATFIDLGVPAILAKGMSVRCPQGRNPRATLDDLGTASRIVQRTWELNERFNPGRNTVTRRARLVAKQGGWATLYEHPGPDDKRVHKTGFGIHSTLYSLLDIDHERDSWGEVKRVIVANRRVVGELDPSLRGDHDEREEIDVYEHWDRVNHGIVLAGTEIVKPLAPHGYVDRMGNPICPWVIKLHEPDEYIKGDTAPTSTSITPIKTLVGHPAVETLIPITKHLSYVLTLIRYMATEAALPTTVIKGNFIYDQGRRVYLFDAATPQDGVERLNNAANIAPTLQLAEFFHNKGQRMGLSDAAAMGNIKDGVSGTAADAMQALPEAKRDALRRTIEEGMAAEAAMILNLVASNTEASVNDRHARKTGRNLPTPVGMTPAEATAHSDNFKGQPLAGSSLITGDPLRGVTALDVEGIDWIEVTVNPMERIPIAQRWQTGTAFLQDQNSPYSPVEILGEFFDEEDPEGIYQRGLMHKLMANPALPFADLLALRGVVAAKRGEWDDPTVERFNQQIAQAEQAAMEKMITDKLTAIQSGGLPQSAPQPGNAPPGASPPGPPGQPGQPMMPPNVTPFPQTAQGAMAPVQAIGGFPPGMAPPPAPPMPLQQGVR